MEKPSLMYVCRPTQHILERTNVVIQRVTESATLIANFCVGLPAHGTTIEGRQCHSIFMQGIPRLISEAFNWGSLNASLAEAHVLSLEDQQSLRYKIVHEGDAIIHFARLAVIIYCHIELSLFLNLHRQVGKLSIMIDTYITITVHSIFVCNCRHDQQHWL